jgi:hypothetical protein
LRASADPPRRRGDGANAWPADQAFYNPVGRFGSLMAEVRIMDCRMWRATGAMLLVTLWVGPLAAREAPIGSVSALVGQAQVTRQDQSRAQPLALGAKVFGGDRIHTAADAKLRLSMDDGSVLTLGAATDLSLDKFNYAPERASRDVLLEVPRGIIRVLVSLLVANSTFEMQSQTAVASVRGTDWIAEAKPDATAIVALDGRVGVRNVRPGIAGEVTLFPGDGTTVRAEQPPSTPKQWGQARKNSFIDRTALP